MDPQVSNPVKPLVNPFDSTSPFNSKPAFSEAPKDESNKPKSKVKTYLVLFGVLLLVVVAILGSYFFLFPKKSGTPILPQEKVVTLPKYFVNCDDVRQVLEEESRLYVACLGGVLIVDKATGEVKDQIGMPDGLSNSTSTSLVKKGNNLFIGTQDGITVFDLKSRESKRLSVPEGLVNGANIQLFEDGDNIWVATFDGVSLVDSKTLKITNFTTDLDAASEKRNIANMLVTDEYVYFLEVGSSNSNGAVVMFEKETKKFTTFKPDVFGQTGLSARVDFNTIGEFNGRVFVAEGNKLFMSKKGEGEWQKIESPNSFITNDQDTEFASVNVLSVNNPGGILLASGEKIYRYNPSTDTTEALYDFGAYPGIIFRNSGTDIWVRGPGKDNWISKLFLSSLKLTSFNLKDRPVSISRLVAVIDNKAVIQSLDGVYEYDLRQDKFKKWEGVGLPTADYGYPEAGFVPIPDTTEIFSVWQSCGQGCEKPVAQVYDYTSNKTTEIEIPENVLDVISTKVQGSVTYDTINLAWHNFSNSEIGFYNSFGQGNPPESLVFNYLDKSWKVLTKVPEGSTVIANQNGVYCNKVYMFSGNGNKFSKDDCTGVAENEQYVWVMENGKIKQTTKANGNVKLLNPPHGTPKYTPFDGPIPEPLFGPITFADHMLWISSDRGLISYNPTDSSYDLYSALEGLLSQEVSRAYIAPNLWVLTNWGGLSAIEK